MTIISTAPSVERAFQKIVADPSRDHWNVRTPDGARTRAEVSIDAQPRIRGFGVTRPPSFEGLPEFWNAIFEVMKETRTILFWPGADPYVCITNPDFLRDLPADLAESVHGAVVVSSGAEICAAVDASAY